MYDTSISISISTVVLASSWFTHTFSCAYACACIIHVNPPLFLHNKLSYVMLVPAVWNPNASNPNHLV